jgi:hypothetical protein
LMKAMVRRWRYVTAPLPHLLHFMLLYICVASRFLRDPSQTRILDRFALCAHLYRYIHLFRPKILSMSGCNRLFLISILYRLCWSGSALFVEINLGVWSGLINFFWGFFAITGPRLISILHGHITYFYYLILCWWLLLRSSSTTFLLSDLLSVVHACAGAVCLQLAGWRNQCSWYTKTQIVFFS